MLGAIIFRIDTTNPTELTIMVRRQCAMLALLAASALVLVAAQQETADRSGRDVYQPPKQPLDPRIDPSKLTEYDPPPLPQQLILPMPPQFRIAQQPQQVPISGGHWNKAQQALTRGLAYLRSAQNQDGGWLTDTQAAPTDQPDKPAPIAVAVTALATKAIIQAQPEAINDAAFHRAIRFMRSA